MGSTARRIGPEALVDLGEVRSVAGVSREVDGAARSLEHEALPERVVAVADAPVREVLGGDGGQANAGRQLDALPPVELVGARDGTVFQNGGVAQAGEEAGVELLLEPPQGRQV